MSNDALDDRPCSIARVDLVFGGDHRMA